MQDQRKNRPGARVTQVFEFTDASLRNEFGVALNLASAIAGGYPSPERSSVASVSLVGATKGVFRFGGSHR